MPPIDEKKQLQQVAAELAKVTEDLAKLRDVRDALIVSLHKEKKLTLRELGALSGLTNVRVLQVLRKAAKLSS